MIEINNLVTELKKDAFPVGKKVRILKGITLHIQPNEIFAVVGPNGAGKSTLIKSILGFITPSTGSISLSPGKKIGFLPENPYYYDFLTLKELLWFSARTFKMSRNHFADQVKKITRKVGLAENLNNKLHNFSKGMTQRAGLAAAIIHDPDIVILDEPMSGLDPLGRKMVFDLIKELQEKGKTILFCSHILSDVERLCDRVAIMKNGQLKKVLNMDDLLLSREHAEILLLASEENRDVLAQAGYGFNINKKHIAIRVHSEELNSILRDLYEKNLKIATIRSREATLENIFYQSISQEEN